MATGSLTGRNKPCALRGRGTQAYRTGRRSGWRPRVGGRASVTAERRHRAKGRSEVGDSGWQTSSPSSRRSLASYILTAFECRFNILAEAECMSTEIGTLLVSSPDVCGGRLRIDGTRITVNQIAVLNKQGYNAEDIADQYPHLTMAQVYAALSHYHANQGE